MEGYRTRAHTHIARAILFKYLKPWCMADECSTVVRCGLMAFKCFSEIQTTSENYPKTTPHKWIHIHSTAMYATSLLPRYPFFVALASGFLAPFNRNRVTQTQFLYGTLCNLITSQPLTTAGSIRTWDVFVSTILLRWAELSWEGTRGENETQEIKSAERFKLRAPIR